MGLLSTELRIGNLVLDGENRLCRVDQLSINHEDCKIYAIKGAITASYRYSGIPLSEELLLKLGFEVNKDYVSEDHLWHDYFLNGVRIQLPYFEFSHEDGDYQIEIKYLHQLQNLYFCLVGKELNTSGL